MTILHIDSSINGENSASRASPARSSSSSSSASGARRSSIATSRQAAAAPDARRVRRHAVLDEFLAADTVVIGAPMYNFTCRASSRRGSTASPSPARPSATPRTAPKAWPGGKRVIVALSRGGFYGAGSPGGLEHVEKLSARRVQLPRHRARVRRRRRARRWARSIAANPRSKSGARRNAQARRLIARPGRNSAPPQSRRLQRAPAVFPSGAGAPIFHLCVRNGYSSVEHIPKGAEAWPN